MKNILNFLLKPWRWYKDRQEHKRRMKQLRDQDPFIYK